MAQKNRRRKVEKRRRITPVLTSLVCDANTLQPSGVHAIYLVEPLQTQSTSQRESQLSTKVHATRNPVRSTHHSIPRHLVLLHAEVCAAMRLEHVVLSKRLCVQQQLQPLPRGELAPGVLASQASLSSPLNRPPLGLLQLLSKYSLKLGNIDSCCWRCCCRRAAHLLFSEAGVASTVTAAAA